MRASLSITLSTLCTWLAGASMLSAASATTAKTNNITELRELRVACLESIHTAKARLDELHQFAELQAQRERSAANQLFLLQQSAASAHRRNGELQQEIRKCTNLLARAQDSVQKATTSYRAAVDSLPTGENWATEGSTALNDLRRAAETALRDTW